MSSGLSRFFTAQGRLSCSAVTPQEDLVAAYRSHLDRGRGIAESTRGHHGATAAQLLDFVGFNDDPDRLRDLGARVIETFLRSVGKRVCRASLQQAVCHLRSFLRFLASRGLVATGLDARIDTPRLYRGERLPCALPWDMVRPFLTATDRSTPMGKRDYAMFLLIATYGLRTSEVAALRLDDIKWRAGRLRVTRPKTKTPLLLPLTDEIGAALIEYLRNARLAAVHTFARYAAAGHPEHLALCQRLLALPFKRAGQRTVEYLEAEEVRAILDAPDRTTTEGRRDHALLLSLFNTGARVQEIVDVRPCELQIVRPLQIRLLGKGRKETLCPLWPQTAEVLRSLLAEHHVDPASTEPLFRNQRGRPLTRFGVRYLLRKYTAIA